MRQYPENSPQAMARVVSMAMLADGAIDMSEIESLKRHSVIDKLGLSPEAFDRVVHEFCDDMLVYASRDSAGNMTIDSDTIKQMLDDIESEELRRKTLRAILDIVNADGELAGYEGFLVSQALKHWEMNLKDVAKVDVTRNSRRWPPQIRRVQMHY